MLRFIIIVTALIPLVAVLFGILENIQYNSLPKPDPLGSIQDRSPLNSKEFGRYTKPLKYIDYSWISSSSIFEFFTLKHWNFKSVLTSRYFIGLAIADFNYVSNAFVYVVDRTNREKCYQYTSRSIFSQAITEKSKSSVDGCTQFYRSSTEYIRLCYKNDEKLFEIDLNVPINNTLQVLLNIKIDYSTEVDKSLTLIYPIEHNRPAYTHKIAALPARGSIRIGNEESENFVDGLSSIDWTLGYPERVCQWEWASLSTIGTNSSNSKKVKIGINLSDLVYNDKNGFSMENSVWIAGQVYTLNRVIYEVPERKYMASQPWQIYSAPDSDTTSPKIHLTFQPWGSLEENINIFVLAGDFIQAFGVYNGTVEYNNHVYVIDNGFGVSENHYAKW